MKENLPYNNMQTIEQLALQHSESCQRPKEISKSEADSAAMPASGKTFNDHVVEFITTDKLERLACLMILCSLITLGIDTELSLKSYYAQNISEDPRPIDFLLPFREFFRWIDVAFTIAYLFELLLRIYAHGLKDSRSHEKACGLKGIWAYGLIGAWKDSWTRLDICVIGASFISFGLAFGLWALGSSCFARVKLFRIMRLLKLLRTVRFLKVFRPLWLLIQGIWTAISTIGASFVLLFCAVYVSGILVVELISKNPAMQQNPDTKHVIDTYYRGVFVSMVSLTRFMHGDGIYDLYEPILWNFPLMTIFFLGLGMIITIALMNTVTGIMVETIIRQVSKDKALQRAELFLKIKKIIPEVKKVFHKFSTDGKGLEQDDFIKAWEELQVFLQKDTFLGINEWDIDIHDGHVMSLSSTELFVHIDTNGNGKIEEDEFVNVVVGLAEEDMGEDADTLLRRIMRSLQQQTENIDTMHIRQQEQSREIAQLYTYIWNILYSSPLPGLDTESPIQVRVPDSE
jgi:hypothetical protein